MYKHEYVSKWHVFVSRGALARVSRTLASWREAATVR
jgi:hypothetical protein